MNATAHQIKVLQASCSGKFRDREERLDSASDLLGIEIRSFKDLTSSQTDDLIRFFTTGKMPDNSSWGMFNKHNTKHRRILSACYTLGWIQEDENLVDLHRLGSFLKSKRSPVQKPLKEMSSIELSKIITCFDNMIEKKYVRQSKI